MSRHSPTCSAAMNRRWCTRLSRTPSMKDRLQDVGGLVQRRPRCHQYDSPAAALATINRLPVLLLPADTFATRASAPVLQELELPSSGDVTVNDAFKPVSRYFDRVWRPEQLPSALLAGMRVLTDPVETGAVTIAIPQDVQAEAFDWPESFFVRTGVARGPPAPRTIGDRTRRRDHPLGSQATDRRRRRSDLQPGHRLSGSVLRADRNPRGAEPGRQGFTGLTTIHNPSGR